MHCFGRKCQGQEAQPIHTGKDASPRSDMTQTAVPIGGVAVDLYSRHGAAQLDGMPETSGIETCNLPFIIGSAVFITVPQ